MLHFKRLLPAAVVSLCMSCSPFGGDDDCEVTETEFGPSHFSTCDVAGYRQAHDYSVDIYTGECGSASAVKFTVPETGTLLPGPNGNIISATLVEGGEVCAEVEFSKGGSREQCRQVRVVREDVWAVVKPDPSSPAGPRSVIMEAGGDIYVGFGTGSNAWNRFDPDSWTWEMRSGVANLADFEAPAGFTVGGAPHIVGRNSILYRYETGLDSWQVVGDVQVGTTLVDVPGFVASDDTTVYGADIGDTGYFGGGPAGALYAYDSGAGTWSERASHPAGHLRGAPVFVLGDRLYVADQVYDPAMDTWTTSGLPADVVGVGVVDGKAYYQDARGVTQVFDGTTTAAYTPRTEEICANPGGPSRSDGHSSSATAGGIAFFAGGGAVSYYLPE